MEPLVSIGMAVLNCEKTLGSAIRSILNQTYSNWELIMIDDGSTDRTLLIAQSFKDPRIKVVSDGLHMNLPCRLNQAIDMSSGKYFARMDGDDISYPERLQVQIDYLEANQDIDLLATGLIVFDACGNPKGKSSLTDIRGHAEICRRPWSGFPMMSHPTWVGKIEWFRTHQYRVNAIRMEDYDLLLRTYETSRFACLPDILFGYRIASLSLKKTLSGRYHQSFAILERAFVENDYLFAFGVVEQAAKAFLDIFAITTGLNFKILRHRLGVPLDAVNLSQWRRVWSECSSKDASCFNALEKCGDV